MIYQVLESKLVDDGNSIAIVGIANTNNIENVNNINGNNISERLNKIEEMLKECEFKQTKLITMIIFFLVTDQLNNVDKITSVLHDKLASRENSADNL